MFQMSTEVFSGTTILCSVRRTPKGTSPYCPRKAISLHGLTAKDLTAAGTQPVMRNGSRQMTEGSNHIDQLEFDQELEATAVAGAAAVQKLIADRNNLREQLAASLASQEELRCRLGIFHQQYIELARKVVSHLHQFDRTMRAASGESPDGPNEMGGSEPKRQFDGEGLPLHPQPATSAPNGNGTSQRWNGLPLEP